MALRCLNCATEVSEGEARLFGGAFCCPTCHLIATRLYERGEKEIRKLLIGIQETIRIALIEGRLHFGEDEIDRLSRADVLRCIGRLMEDKQHKTPNETQRKDST